MPSPPGPGSAEPGSRPQAGPSGEHPPRFLCDAMLAHLARWLRAAGYDTALAPPQARDGTLLEIARREGRILLTCDRSLSAPDVEIRRLPMTGLPELARILQEEFGIDWLHAPFSRCLVDNAELEELNDPIAAGIPEPARRLPGPFTRCPRCGRLFWPGSHVRRMKARLARWNRATPGPARGPS